jgi:hypothetical protein
MRPLAITLCLLATPALADVAGVASVLDGEAIEVHGQRIRLHGIDAPESRQLCRRDGKPWRIPSLPFAKPLDFRGAVLAPSALQRANWSRRR